MKEEVLQHENTEGEKNDPPSTLLRYYHHVTLFELLGAMSCLGLLFFLLTPIFGIILSAITLGYIFLDRSVKPAFRRGISS